VYWSSSGDTNGFNGSINKIPVNGNGGQKTLLAGSLPSPGPIAIDGTNVYFTTTGGDAGGSVMKVPLGGGAPTTLASGQADPWGIVVDTSAIYWANTGTAAASYTDGSIMKLPLTSTTPVTLASQQSGPFYLAVDSANVYWTNSAQGTPGQPGQLMTAPIAGNGQPTVLVSNVVGGGPVAVNATTVFWAASTGATSSSIKQLALQVGADAGTFVGNLSNPQAIVLDSADMYFTDNDQVQKVPLTGGTPSQLAVQRLNPAGVAVDCGSAYWVDQLGGTVNKVTPK
jgi:hypothetical protein